MSAPALPDDPGGLRLALNWFHTWFGLVVGALLFIIFWTGTLAVAFHGLEAGHELHAYVAMFVTLRDGLIAHQASYDCYESFDPARDRAPTAAAVEQEHHQAPDASRVP